MRGQSAVSLTHLPRDVLGYLTQFLTLEDSKALSTTSKQMLDAVRKAFVQNARFVVNHTFLVNIKKAGAWKRDILHIRLLYTNMSSEEVLVYFPKLRSMKLGFWFNLSLNLQCVPKLTSLHLGYWFNKPLNLEYVPNLTLLCLGKQFNRPLNLKYVPNLQTLTIYSYQRKLIFNASAALKIIFQ